MEIHRSPTLTNVIGLLEKAGLPYSDLDASAMAHFFSIESDQETIATIGLELLHPYGLLRSLVVEANFRKHRLGFELVDKLEEHAKQQKIKQLFLLTNDADLYFAKLGFCIITRDLTPEAVKHSTQFRSLCPDTAIVMTKHLA